MVFYKILQTAKKFFKVFLTCHIIWIFRSIDFLTYTTLHDNGVTYLISIFSSHSNTPPFYELTEGIQARQS